MVSNIRRNYKPVVPYLILGGIQVMYNPILFSYITDYCLHNNIINSLASTIGMSIGGVTILYAYKNDLHNVEERNKIFDGIEQKID